MLPVIPPVACLTNGGNRWGVILAGGDGTRLQKLTRLICGDERPKQFCPLFGGKTLLEQTLQRSVRTIPEERIIVSLTAHHSKWYSREAGLRPAQRIVQPANKGTAPPILHSVLSLVQLDPHALVAILPCDHHYSDEDSFTSALERAFEAAAERIESVVLLGAKPNGPEVEYGWIELGPTLGDESSELFRVRGFREKPPIDFARMLFDQGAVWNTFVMVGHVQAFLRLIQETLPDLLGMLGTARMWTGKETHIQQCLYERIPDVSFSHRVLSAEIDQLLVLRLNEVGWSDLGDPGRAFVAARESNSELEWIQTWQRARDVDIEAA
jgi:mannose-1-phosphate guanylyltransferase